MVFNALLVLIPLLMPFHYNLTNLCILLMTLCWLVEGNWVLKKEQLLNKPIILAFGLFYFMFFLGSFYSDNLSVAAANLERKFSLFLLPLVLGTSTYLREIKRATIFYVFITSCTIATVICLINALCLYVKFDDSNVFFHEQLSSIIDFHPPYFGLYLCLGILMLLIEIFSGNQKFSSFLLIKIFLAAFFFIMLILLSARTVTAFLIIVLVLLFIRYFYVRRKLILGLVLCVMVLLVTTGLIFSSSYLRDRIIRPLTSDINVIDGGGETGLSIRLVKWKCSLQGILAHPILGVGTGDSIDYLVACYEREEFWGMYPQYRFNSHNQYLETGLMLGMPGIIIFLVCMLIPLHQAIKQKDHLLIGFVALYAFASMTESLLERQWGIALFAYFISFLVFKGSNRLADGKTD